MQVLSSLDANAEYESLNELTNQFIYQYYKLHNKQLHLHFTDCPQRDERIGWTGDAQIFTLSGSYVADTYNFMRQWMDTVRADCGENRMSSRYCPLLLSPMIRKQMIKSLITDKALVLPGTAWW